MKPRKGLTACRGTCAKIWSTLKIHSIKTVLTLCLWFQHFLGWGASQGSQPYLPWECLQCHRRLASDRVIWQNHLTQLSDFSNIQNLQLSDPTSSLPSPPTSMTSSLTSFGFTQEQVFVSSFPDTCYPPLLRYGFYQVCFFNSFIWG